MKLVTQSVERIDVTMNQVEADALAPLWLKYADKILTMDGVLGGPGLYRRVLLIEQVYARDFLNDLRAIRKRLGS